MKIANEIEMLELTSDVMGRKSIINPVLIWNNEKMILVDTGFPGQLTQIKEKFANIGADFTKLDMIILTHQDIDHIGNASSILKELPNKKVKILAFEEEQDFIEGKQTPHKLAKLESNIDLLPKDMLTIYEKLKEGFGNSQVMVDEVLKDGNILPYYGGIEIIYTPGHTIGHICVYLKKYKILIAGDMLRVENEILQKMSETINFDNNLYISSLKKLTEYDIETVICYHGGIYNKNVNECIKELIN